MEMQDRVVDGLCAVRNAQQGVVAGGGCALLRASYELNSSIKDYWDKECSGLSEDSSLGVNAIYIEKTLSEHKLDWIMGWNAIKDALKQPFYRIIENSNGNAA